MNKLSVVINTNMNKQEEIPLQKDHVQGENDNRESERG